MKCLWALLVLVQVIQWASTSSCSHWKTRMDRYGALVNCQYYATSENEYKDYFEFNEVENETEDDKIEIHFFALSQSAIKFKLSSNNETDSLSYTQESLSSATEENRYHRGWRYKRSEYEDDAEDYNDDPLKDNSIDEEIDTTTTTSTTTTAPTPPYHPNKTFEIVIGHPSNSPLISTSGDVIGNTVYVESYILRNGRRLKSLATPGIVRTNEPNEFLIEIFSDGKLRATINDNTILETKDFDLNYLKYISFAASKDRVVQEFFYKCNLE